MSRPPYPPQGGDEPGGDEPGSRGWEPPGADDPTRQLNPPARPPNEGQRDQTQQFGQPGPSGQQPYGQQAPSGQQPYGQQAPYGQPPYGQPPYGPPPYGPPPYGQQPYGRPIGQPGQQWGPPGGQPPKGNRSTLIALVVAGVVVLAAVGVALWLLLGNDSDSATARATTSETTAPSSEGTTSSRSTSSPPTTSESAEPTDAVGIPPAAVPPDALGDDAGLDELAQLCYDGSMESCDLLYGASEEGSAYRAYGDTCAGRQPEGTQLLCTTAFPGE